MSIRVPVFSAVHLNRILHWVSPLNAIRMCEENKAHPIASGTALRLLLPENDSNRSPGSLTAFDARAAAGEYGESRTARMGERKKRELEALGKPTEDAVECSDAKLELWREIHDDLAVLA